MSAVRMTHPDLPDQPIEVDEVSVPHYQASGWQVADETTRPAAKGRRQTRKEES